MVVDVHRLGHHAHGLLQVGGAAEQELALEDPVDPLGQGVLVAVVAVGHRACQAMALVDALILARAVLDAPV